MSELKFSCSHCGQNLTGVEEWAGRMLQCPSCQRESATITESRPERELFSYFQSAQPSRPPPAN